MENECKKCGSTDIHVRYLHIGGRIPTNISVDLKGRLDYLSCRCKCGYSWSKRCKDDNTGEKK